MTDISDNGPNPFIIDIEDVTLENENYRTTIWTGKYLQTTVMAIPVGSDIGLEVHEDHDQFLRIEEGEARVDLGPAEDNLTEHTAEADDAVFVPAGTWHNITNIGDEPLKLYSIYAPPEHPHGTVHPTKADAEAHEE